MNGYNEELRNAFMNGVSIERFRDHRASVACDCGGATVVHFNDGSFDYSITFALVKENPRWSTKLFITGDLGDATFEFHMAEVTLKKISRIRDPGYLWSKMMCSSERRVHDYRMTREAIEDEVHELFSEAPYEDRCFYDESEVVDGYMDCYFETGWDYPMLGEVDFPDSLSLDISEMPDCTELPARFYLWFIALREVVRQMEFGIGEEKTR